MATDVRTIGPPPKAKPRRTVELKIDRGIYLVDDETRTYRYARRNWDWPWLDPGENERNKRHIMGYTRIFRDGRRKIFGSREW